MTGRAIGPDEPDDASREFIRALGRVVGSEATRVFSEENLRADPALLEAGWTRRFIADGRRAAEAVALYQDLGFDVLTEPVTPDDVGYSDDCQDCQLLGALRFQMVYTRPIRRNEAPSTEKT